jgi:hypothetical protein
MKQPENQSLRDHLLTAARAAAGMLLSEHPVLPRYREYVSVLLVGSAASGYADESSDVDLWVVCADEAAGGISEQFARSELRFDVPPPHTLTQDGTQVHYFAFPASKLERGLKLHDDDVLYQTKHCVVCHDAGGQFARLSLYGELPAEAVHGKIADAYAWMRIYIASARELLPRYQPSPWLRCIGDLVSRSLGLIAWLDGEPPSPQKWAFRQVESLSTSPIILPAIKQVLRATGPILDCEEDCDERQELAAALDALDSAARQAVDAAGYTDIPTPALHKV